MSTYALLMGPDTRLGARIRQVLSRLKVRVEVVRDGLSGLAAATSNQPNVIILDPDLPNLDSEKLYWQLKHKPQTRHIPLIVLSDEADGYLHQPDLTFGDFHLAKNVFTPFALVELLRFMDFIDEEPGSAEAHRAPARRENAI